MLIINEKTEHLILPNRQETLPDGSVVGVHDVNGHKRYFSRKPAPLGAFLRFARPFSELAPIIPRSKWPQLIKEQALARRRVSDFQNFPPHDQDGLPSCWRNGSAHAATTCRVIQGLPYVELSSNSLCPEISYNSGGYEGDSAEALKDYGACSTKTWPNNSTKRLTGAAIDAERARHRAIELYYLDEDNAEKRFAQFATACLMTFAQALAFNRWSHVISGGDLIQLGNDRFGGKNRNNWGPWGDNNDFGQPGYAVFEEGGWTPSSGVVFRTMTMSEE